MKHSKLLGTLALAVLVAGALSVSACHRHRTPEERADWLAGKIAKELDLNDRQKEQLEAVKQEFLSARSEMAKDHQAVLDEVLAQVQQDRLDQPKLLQLLDQHHALQNRLAPRLLAKVAEFHAGLTAKQKAEAAERLKYFKERMRRHEGDAKM
jgi:Spy/CpxP family protein refolding chaperone